MPQSNDEAHSDFAALTANAGLYNSMIYLFALFDHILVYQAPLLIDRE